MAKLNKKKINYLILEAKKNKPTSLIARELKISQRRVQQLYRLHNHTGLMPVLKKERRPQVPLKERQKQLIDHMYKHHKVGARLLKIALDEDYPGNKISKNKIYAYLKEKGLSHADRKKQKQRKRTRYERKHSGSLVHVDTHYCKWKPGWYLMTCMDDASRKVLAAHEVKRITAHNAILTLKQAIKEAAKYNVLIHQVNTDRGPEFFAQEKGKKQRKVHACGAMIGFMVN